MKDERILIAIDEVEKKRVVKALQRDSQYDSMASLIRGLLRNYVLNQRGGKNAI